MTSFNQRRRKIIRRHLRRATQTTDNGECSGSSKGFGGKAGVNIAKRLNDVTCCATCLVGSDHFNERRASSALPGTFAES
jgi:hypothetical protein